MTDYIKREDAIKTFENICIPRKATNGIVVLDIDEALSEIELVPSADVVEVVRCKDCKHYNEYENGEKIMGEEEVYDGWCMRWSGIENVNRHDYCSYGERAEA